MGKWAAELESLNNTRLGEIQTTLALLGKARGEIVKLKEDIRDLLNIKDERDKYKREASKAQALLMEAAEDVASWGAYASEYFQQKHDLAGCIEKYRSHGAAIDAARGKA